MKKEKIEWARQEAAERRKGRDKRDGGTEGDNDKGGRREGDRREGGRGGGEGCGGVG